MTDHNVAAPDPPAGPVAGPVAQVVCTAVSDTPITLAEHERLVVAASGGKAGAVVGFTGAVRDHDHGADVVELRYSSHPTAEKVLAEIVAGIAAQADGVRAIAVSHRVGDLVVGDVAFVVAVAADHRRAAFEACARLVDDVKAGIPVWKHQIFADGTDEWVNSA